jgi:hypothetical protein
VGVLYRDRASRVGSTSTAKVVGLGETIGVSSRIAHKRL